jgi:hypothetical protein
MWCGVPIDKGMDVRRRIAAESEAEFPVFRDYRAAGMTDYVAIINRFAPEGTIGEMDCVYSSWALALSVKAAALATPFPL